MSKKITKAKIVLILDIFWYRGSDHEIEKTGVKDVIKKSKEEKLLVNICSKQQEFIFGIVKMLLNSSSKDIDIVIYIQQESKSYNECKKLVDEHFLTEK